MDREDLEKKYIFMHCFDTEFIRWMYLSDTEFGQFPWVLCPFLFIYKSYNFPHEAGLCIGKWSLNPVATQGLPIHSQPWAPKKQDPQDPETAQPGSNMTEEWGLSGLLANTMEEQVSGAR